MQPKKRLAWLAALFTAFMLIAAACGGDDDSSSSDSSSSDSSGDLSGSINISGSSTVEPISTRVAELFEEVAPDVAITVDGPGTGDGFKLFCEGETDVSGASRQIKDAESEQCVESGIEYVELEVAFDGIAVMTNPANTAVECLSFVDLYALLGPEAEGNGGWSDSSGVASEMGSTIAPYPDADLTISAPGTESGTYDSFIEIVLEGQAEDRLGEDIDTFIRTDFAGNADDNVIIQGIAGSDTSLGWVGFAFAEENADAVKTLQVSEVPGGDCVTPTIESIADGSYPVSRSLYIYVNKEKAESNPALVPFIDYYLGDAYNESVTTAFGESGYVALPDDLLAETAGAWSGR